MYGYCNDANGDQFSSCYAIKDGYTESDIVMAAGTFESASNEAYYEYVSSDDCNLDEANGKYSNAWLPCLNAVYFRCNSSHHRRVLLLHDRDLPLGTNVLLW